MEKVNEGAVIIPGSINFSGRLVEIQKIIFRPREIITRWNGRSAQLLSLTSPRVCCLPVNQRLRLVDKEEKETSSSAD